ncbi:MAG: NAD(P)/FAD-dependent oxidoreductase [Oscillospiraceae bacterium]|nr:NAD(P)/FAD-dependent oxidoreductase [Oscillospiraceae bacterium]
MRVLIIGGGASGLTAALTAAECPDNQVTLLERQARVGRKLTATGNGRCNLTNLHAGPDHYHGQRPDFVRPALENFGVQTALAWFSSLGLVTAAEPSGRVYPFSDQAGSVVDVLRLALEQSGARVETGCETRALTWRDGAFFAETEGQLFTADRVIVACGGVAGGRLGGTDAGYRLLASLGHTRTALYPALVQLRTDPACVRALKGIRTQAAVSLRRGEETLGESQGEIQFAEYGLSGPCIFALSRAVSASAGEITAVLDLLPQMEQAALERLLREKAARFPALTLENLLTGVLQNRLGRTVVRFCGLVLDAPLSSLSAAKLHQLAAAVKAFPLPVTGTLGMDQAQVTAGGVCTGEFDPDTLESRLCPALYACGEVLDVDGDCGGYNLQWAWSSGRLAGQMKGTNR